MALNGTSILIEALPALGLQALADADSHWSESELYRALDRASETLARQAGLRVQASSIGPLVAGQAVYSLPSRFVAPLAEFIGTAQVERRATAHLEALSADWPVMAAETPSHTVLDLDGPGNIRTFPTPTAAGASFTSLHRALLPEVAAGTPFVNLPEFLSEFLYLAAIREAREREGPAQAKEVSALAGDLMNVLLSAAADLYGGPA